MHKIRQWTLRTWLITALLAASGVNQLQAQAEQREAKPDNATTANVSEEKPLVLQPNDVKKVQDNLRDKGYYGGQVDGILGPRTKAAIRQYQKTENLPVTGRLDAQTAGKLGVGPESVGGSFKGAGQEVGEGSKEAGHEIKQGKPVAAGKEMGKGLGRGGKKAGHGIKRAVTTESDRGDREKQPQPENEKEPQ
jgi:peptidoglycan hydrolase-like protein with peptidoglycan-binding domain